MGRQGLALGCGFARVLSAPWFPAPCQQAAACAPARRYGGTGAALALAAAVAMRPPRPMYPVSELETYAALAARGIASAAGEAVAGEWNNQGREGVPVGMLAC